MRVIPFCGYPICIIKTNEILNDDELSFLKSLDNKQHMETLNTRTKLTKSVNILNNIELTRIKDFVWKYFCDYVDNVLEVENNQFCPPYPDCLSPSVFIYTQDTSNCP